MDETVIIGGGQAGMKTAMGLRKYGYVGGITIVGAETYAPYERPPLSKGFLMNADAPIAWVNHQEDASITLKAGCTATSIDRVGKRVQLSDGTHLSYTSVVLATGGTCRKLNMGSSASFHEVRTIEDARLLYGKLGESIHVTIVGAGVIGLEVAASARKRGLGVAIVEYGSQIMNRNMPDNFASKIKELHDRVGVVFHMNDCLKKVISAGSGYSLELDSGTSIATDCIVLGIGITPNVELAQEAGIEVANGVLVSKGMRTSDPDIFAVGDIACVLNDRTGQRERIESWQNANVTATIAAAVICGAPLPSVEVPWFWSDQYDANIQVAGWPLQADKTIWREKGGTIVAFYLLNEELIGACTLNAGGDMSVIRRMMNAGMSPSEKDLTDPTVKLRGLFKSMKK